MAALPVPAAEPATPAAEARPTEQFAAEHVVVVPLRVHVLTADDPIIDCKLTDDDIRRIVGKVNRVWRPAGVYFGLESIVREPAAGVERFRKVREQIGAAPMGLYVGLIPEASRALAGLHVYYVHKLPVNGAFMGSDYAFVQETAALREVEGGIDEPIPRVTSHELGHALGLQHRQDRTNLMASGTTGTSLNAAEVAAARERAGKTPGAMSLTKARQAADEAATRAGGDAVAQRVRGWIAEIESAPAQK